MSLLSICQEVAQDLALAVPAAVIGNSDETATRLLAASQLAGKSLARKPQGGWVNMIREYDFYTAALGPQAGSISNNSDGFAVISGISVTPTILLSMLAAGWTVLSSGPASGTPDVSPYVWYAFGQGVPSNAIVTAATSSTVTLNQAATQTSTGVFQFGQSDYLLPNDFDRPIDGTMWDRSRYWQMRGPQSPQQWQRYKSSAIGQASIQRRFRFRRLFGAMRFSIDPVPTDNGSSLVFEYVSNAWCQDINGNPQTEWGADSDTGILDEYLITLGLRWRMLRRLGLSYAEELSEYESEVRKAMAADGGAAILSLVNDSSSFLLSPSNVQEASFPGPT
jgi:hypothetical protein